MERQSRSNLGKRLAIILFATALAGTGAQASAAVTATVGTSVVTTPDRSANFSALPLLTNINGHVENGIQFNFDLSQGHASAQIVNSNWACCGAFIASQGFTGNVAYFNSDGSIPYKYAAISTSDGATFTALQFQIASGYGGATNAYWEAYDQANLVGSGSFRIGPVSSIAPATVVGFSGGDFTQLRIGTYSQPFTTFAFQGTNGNAVEIANVLANVNPVPEPEAFAMLVAGLVLVSVVARRKEVGRRSAG